MIPCILFETTNMYIITSNFLLIILSSVLYLPDICERTLNFLSFKFVFFLKMLILLFHIIFMNKNTMLYLIKQKICNFVKKSLKIE